MIMLNRSPHASNKIPCVIAILAMFLGSCSKTEPVSPEVKAAFESVIPRPVATEITGFTFFIDKNTVIVAVGDDPEIRRVAELLAQSLRSSELPLEIVAENEAPGDNLIVLSKKDADEELGDEGYELRVTEDRIDITARHAAGLFYGTQTLRQIAPSPAATARLPIATGVIRDYPRYAWRGSMLDVARHFFEVNDVKRYIDLMSLYKMNRLHLGLTNDQGWRIEIKSWPKLTEIGAITEVGGGEGGFFTQEQYKEIVAYAQDRHVMIIPEIDMPGHTNAALASYQELNINPSMRREPGIPRPDEEPVPGQLYTGIKVGFSTLDITKPITFKFVEDVLAELAAITPGPYIHIGGDEAAVTKKPDYIAFINRFKTIVEGHGKTMIGWEEISQADIDSTVIVQYWNSPSHAKAAAAKGARLIYSPAKKIYLDMQYDSTTRLGLHWAAYIEVDDSYNWDPVTHVADVPEKCILGVEAPLWTETIETIDDIEYMVFPRLAGVAEIGWSRGERSWGEYVTRLARQAPRWEAMGVDFYRSPKVHWPNAE